MPQGVNYLTCPEALAAERATRAHYELSPFIEGGPPRAERWARRFQDLQPDLRRGGPVLDLGCGSGEVSQALAATGAQVVAVDLTTAAVRQARARGIAAAQASALALPFPDRAFEHSVALGVLHHTHSCADAFSEMARVTQREMTILLYQRWTPYHLVYAVLGPVRCAVRLERVRSIPRWLFLVLRPLLWFSMGLWLDEEQTSRVVADQLWTPVATFHSRQEVCRWAKAHGFHVVRQRRARGYSFTLVLGRGRPNDVPAEADRERATQRHYETFPFIEGGPRRVRHWDRRMRSLLDDQDLEGTVVLDVGCGSGEPGLGLVRRGAKVINLDLTGPATIASHRVNGGASVQASTLHLPIADASVDHATAIGVLHHTPDARRGLAELARVSRRRIVILLYARWTPNHLAYVLATPLRRLPVTVLERLPRWSLRVMRVVVAVQVARIPDDDQLRRLVADQFWTPVASFHTYREVRRWADALGLRVVARRRLLFQANLLVFERRREFTSLEADELSQEVSSAPHG